MYPLFHHLRPLHLPLIDMGLQPSFWQIHINNDAYFIAAQLHSPHLVTSGFDCTWITSAEECNQTTSEAYQAYLGSSQDGLDLDEAPHGCLTFDYSGIRVSAFNYLQTDIPCGAEICEGENCITMDCVCKGNGMTALPMGDPDSNFTIPPSI